MKLLFSHPSRANTNARRLITSLVWWHVIYWLTLLSYRLNHAMPCHGCRTLPALGCTTVLVPRTRTLALILSSKPLRNRLLLNMSKTKELVCRKFGIIICLLLLTTLNTWLLQITRCIFQSNLKMDTTRTVSIILLSQYTQLLHLLILLRYHGIPLSPLTVFTQTICFTCVGRIFKCWPLQQN